MHDSIPTLYLVGAGPGDPELITIKGLRAIQQADVILYDALASKELLAYAKPTSKLVYVGKRSNKHAFSQDDINKLIIFYTSRYRHVLRLKGGDPFVFGRGHEEMEYAMKHGVKVEVIPGISSALSAPASVGMPLTKRGVNESFWVITGTLSNGDISSDLQLAARSTATVIVLMGMERLSRIMEVFRKERNEDEPVAIIQQATLPEQKFVRGNVNNIQRMVRDREITSPAVIVIGKVVAESLLAEQVQCIFTTQLLKIAV